MAKVNVWNISDDSTIKLGSDNAILLPRKRSIRLQILLHTYLKEIHLSLGELECLVLLAIKGTADYLDFCRELADIGIFASVQSSRNSITRIEEKGLLYKKGSNRKTVSITPELCIQSEGNVLINVKCFTHETSKD